MDRKEFLKVLIFLFILIFFILITQQILSTYLISINFDFCISSILATVIVSNLFDKRLIPQFLVFEHFLIKNLIIVLIISISILSTIFAIKYYLSNFVINNHIIFHQVIDLMLSMLFVAIYEEIVFRGLLFEWIYSNFGSIVAILFTSIIFSLFHFYNNGFDLLSFLNVFLAGVMFAFLFYKSGTIWLSIVFHFIWNVSLPLFIDSSLSGYSYISIIHFQNQYEFANNLLFGSEFGLESGLITTLAILLVLILTAKMIKTSPYYEAIRLKKLYKV